MRFLVSVKSCQKDARDGVHQTIRETWGKNLPAGFDLLFFVGGEKAPISLEKDEIYLPVPDGYWDLQAKTLAIARYATEKGYDFVCLCDTDAYIDFQKLLSSGFEHSDYSGGPTSNGQVLGKVYPNRRLKDYSDFVVSPYYTYLSGHAYILSRKAMQIVAASSFPRVISEDVLVGQILGPFIATGEIIGKVIPEGAFVHLHCGYHGGEGIQIKPECLRNHNLPVPRKDVSAAIEDRHKWLTSPKKTALVVIATGKIYWRYAENMIASARKFFIPHDVFLFTDCPTKLDVKKQIYIPYTGFTAATLLRYHHVLLEQQALSEYDNIFYCDSDMLFVDFVAEEEVLSSGITVVEHPGYTGHPQDAGFESNPRCAAYVEKAKAKYYFAGGFNGGSSAAYLKMANTIRAAVDTDFSNRVMASWYDESYLNRYCFDNPPAKILTPSFCYPRPDQHYRDWWVRVLGTERANTIVPKLVAVSKTAEEFKIRQENGGPK